MVCVCKDGKRKYKSLGISTNPRFWDFEKNKPKRNCPNKEKIENFIADKIKDLDILTFCPKKVRISILRKLNFLNHIVY